MSDLKEFLTRKADEISPLDKEWPDRRQYSEDVNSYALDRDAWLKTNTSYIWKVGILAQWDSNKCDHADLFIGHERAPGELQFIGHLRWDGRTARRWITTTWRGSCWRNGSAWS